MHLKDRVAVVTGAASGIGRAVATSLAKRGCHLALCDVDSQGLAETIRPIVDLGIRCTTHVLDITDPRAVYLLPEIVVRMHGAVHLLVNNAGVSTGGTFEQVSEEDFDWVMQVNFHALVRMTRAFLPQLRSVEESRIVNVSSLWGLVSPPELAAYSASKFAVRGFSGALRHELRSTQVGVTVIHPGGIATSISASARLPKGISDQAVERRRLRSERLLRMPPEQAGEIIVNGIVRNAVRVLVGTDAKLISLLERLAPVQHWILVNWLMSRLASEPRRSA